jgi:hypothetical protein
MLSASAELRAPQSESQQIALQKARQIQGADELDTFLLQVVTHECTSASCRSCQVLAEIRAFVKARVFETVIYSRTE